METSFKTEDRFSKISISFAFLVLALGGLFGLLQLLTRTPYSPLQLEPATYYLSVTAHGVLLAIVWTAFFIMGLAAFVITRELGQKINSVLLNVALILTLAGTLMAAIAILSGTSNVLYTFYPPLKANAFFYLGAAILLIGTWIFAVAIFLAFFNWRKKTKAAIPLATMGVLTTLIVWLEATPGLAIEVLKNLIPMALFDTPVDALESRTYFWYFGHALVYFWLLPAITLWYFFLPKLLNTTIYSEKAAKAAFILFILFSTPVGLHHQFQDPGVSPQYKFLHTVLTYLVTVPSFMTAFNLLATMEKSYREKGGKSLFGWIKHLPWKDGVFVGIAVSMILFAFGGISGIINAAYTINAVVHNTVWVVGHFHLTVGTAVTLTFMAASYVIIPALFGKAMVFKRFILAQPYLWLIGMLIFSTSFHVGGLLGIPRRTADILYGGSAPSSWIPLAQIAAIGGIILFISGVIFIFNSGFSLLRGPRVQMDAGSLFENKNEDPTILDKLSIWVVIAIVIILVAYILPFMEIYSRGLSPAPPTLP